MPLLNFKPQFVEPIRSGRKHHTIRATRKQPVKKGDSLYLYSGLRHKGAFRIQPEGVVCTRVESIEILPFVGDWPAVIVDGTTLSRDEKEQLAQADGFANFPEMMIFWEGRLPFTGQIIHWR